MMSSSFWAQKAGEEAAVAVGERAKASPWQAASSIS